jgi:hypothetical protein
MGQLSDSDWSAVIAPTMQVVIENGAGVVPDQSYKSADAEDSGFVLIPRPADLVGAGVKVTDWDIALGDDWSTGWVIKHRTEQPVSIGVRCRVVPDSSPKKWVLSIKMLSFIGAQGDSPTSK